MQDNNPIIKTSVRNIISFAIGATGLAIVVGLIIGGALLAGQKWNPTWDPFMRKTSQPIQQKDAS